MSNSPIEVAKAYVEASNAHDLTTIEPMLSVDCEYQSSGVGHHAGSAFNITQKKGRLNRTVVGAVFQQNRSQPE